MADRCPACTEFWTNHQTPDTCDHADCLMKEHIKLRAFYAELHKLQDRWNVNCTYHPEGYLKSARALEEKYYGLHLS